MDELRNTNDAPEQKIEAEQPTDWSANFAADLYQIPTSTNQHTKEAGGDKSADPKRDERTTQDELNGHPDKSEKVPDGSEKKEEKKEPEFLEFSDLYNSAAKAVKAEQPGNNEKLPPGNDSDATAEKQAGQLGPRILDAPGRGTQEAPLIKKPQDRANSYPDFQSPRVPGEQDARSKFGPHGF